MVEVARLVCTFPEHAPVIVMSAMGKVNSASVHRPVFHHSVQMFFSRISKSYCLFSLLDNKSAVGGCEAEPGMQIV